MREGVDPEDVIASLLIVFRRRRSLFKSLVVWVTCLLSEAEKINPQLALEVYSFLLPLHPSPKGRLGTRTLSVSSLIQARKDGLATPRTIELVSANGDDRASTLTTFGRRRRLCKRVQTLQNTYRPSRRNEKSSGVIWTILRKKKKMACLILIT